jgi:hypothetical protein
MTVDWNYFLHGAALFHRQQENILNHCIGYIGNRRTREGFALLLSWQYNSPSRNMHALRRLNLECSLKIYVEIYEESRVYDKCRVISFPGCNLDCYSVCTSDCVGWRTKGNVVRRKLKHGAARTGPRASCCTSNTRWAINEPFRSKFAITEYSAVKQIVSSRK